MQQLFPTEQKGHERTIEYYRSIFNSIGYDFKHIELSIGSNVIKLFPLQNIYNFIFVIPWIRPMSISISDFTKILADYPRINIPSHLLHEPDDLKILGMLSLIKDNQLYFLIIIPRPSFDFFWLDTYEKVFPKMKLTYREKNKPLDRMHLPVYSGQDFKKLNNFKNKLDLIFKS